MRRSLIKGAVIVGLVLLACGTAVSATTAFKIPFTFQAGGKKHPAGNYEVIPLGNAQLSLRRIPDGAEVLVPFTQRLAQPVPPVVEPQLVFDMVGNFEPSYTEYVTDYVLAELWMPGEEGYLVKAMKGAHQHKTIAGQKTEK
jgi:hypothetical protein